ncbi:MAG: hypothetical protein AAGU21_10440 [Solidesulfovibrio sp.]|uniref:hypothetical protein n=1 Tax=Solidesulfovibrio sp. TaxID=2910990 RepID=UPI002B1FE4B8|nr:hypothetical protein [Solidesulfovibrio sp.]MEA4856763.1 hypothetical protein [Solidesulfovibrio sp.]
MTFAELKRRLPPRTLAFLAVGALIAGGFMAIFIVPDYRQCKVLAAENEGLRATLEVRRQMVPVVESLKKARASLPEVEGMAGKERLPLAEVGQLASVMDGMAVPLGLRLTQVSPDPSSVTRDGLVAVRLVLLGEPDKFRDFLLALGRYAPLAKIESVVTHVGHDGREYRVKCWLAVSSAG